jgi:oligopeptide transport system ATP-binding protein
MAEETAVGPLVKVRDLKMYFPIHAGLFKSHVGDIKAVDGISFDILPGETLGLVGESGCGKSTVGRSILRLYDITGGTVEINGNEIAQVDRDSLRSKRPMMQMIFQDPQASLNPRMTVASIIAEPLDEHLDLTDDERLARVYELMDWVGLNPASPTATRTNSPAVSASASGSRALWRSSPPSSSATNRSPRSTCRSRRRWSTCWKSCKAGSA